MWGINVSGTDKAAVAAEFDATVKARSDQGTPADHCLQQAVAALLDAAPDGAKYDIQSHGHINADGGGNMSVTLDVTRLG